MATSVKSPLPGTFYHAASPDDPPFKKAGDTVDVGEVIGLVEVMKNFMEIKSTETGIVKTMLVANEEPVTAGQALLELED